MQIQVLLLEPSRLYQQILREMLSQHQDVKLTIHEGSQSGLEATRLQHFDLICVSMHLADGSGIDFCEKARAEPALSSVPILLITSENNQETLGRALRAGATDILKKSEISAFDERMASLLPIASGSVGISGKILLIEDDPDQAKALSMALEHSDFEVIVTKSVEEALAGMETQGIDVVLADVLLGNGQTGIDFIRQLRTRSAWQTVPVMALSAAKDERRRLMVLSSGAQDFMSKPVSNEELVIRLRNLLSTRRLFQQIERDRERLREMATTDALTGLYNRAFLVESAERRLSEAKRHKQPVSLIIGDIDFFKKINDTHGHDQGDVVLRAVGKLLSTFFRDEDLPARFGGEEFVILLNHCNGENALRKAEALRQAISDLKPGDLTVTMSLGVTERSGENETFDQLFKRADDALYKAKHGGRNQVVVS